MLNIFRGHRPDVTPAQLGAFLLAGIPVVSKLAGAFGVWDPSPEQEQALSDAVQWGVIGGGALIVGDTGIRAARNHADATVNAAALSSSATPPIGPTGGGQDPELPADEHDDEFDEDELDEEDADAGEGAEPGDPPLRPLGE